MLGISSMLLYHHGLSCSPLSHWREVPLILLSVKSISEAVTMIAATVSKLPLTIVIITAVSSQSSTGAEYLSCTRCTPGKLLIMSISPRLVQALGLRLDHVVWQRRLAWDLNLVREPEHHTICLEVPVVMFELVVWKIKHSTAKLCFSPLLIPEGARLVHIPPGVGEDHISMSKHRCTELQHAWD